MAKQTVAVPKASGKRLTALLKDTDLVDAATQLDAAIENEDVETVAELLKKHSIDGKVLKQMINGVIENGNQEVDAKILFKLLEVYKASSADLVSFLHRSCTTGPAIIVKVLLDKGANPVDSSDETYCVMMAINEQHTDVLTLLLEQASVISMINEYNEGMGCRYFLEQSKSLLTNTDNKNTKQMTAIVDLLTKHKSIQNVDTD